MAMDKSMLGIERKKLIKEIDKAELLYKNAQSSITKSSYAKKRNRLFLRLLEILMLLK